MGKPDVEEKAVDTERKMNHLTSSPKVSSVSSPSVFPPTPPWTPASKHNKENLVPGGQKLMVQKKLELSDESVSISSIPTSEASSQSTIAAETAKILSPLTPCKKRRRSPSGDTDDTESEQPYDFSKSPTSGKEAMKSWPGPVKRAKLSISPRKKPETPNAVPTEQLATPVPVVVSKALSVKERLAAIKAKRDAGKLTPKPKQPIEAKSRLQQLKQNLQKHKAANEKISTPSTSRVMKEVQKETEHKKRINDSVREYIKSAYPQIPVDEKIRQLKLPAVYGLLKKKFKSIDQVVVTMHNSGKTVLVGSALRDASKQLRTNNCTEGTLRRINGLMEDAYEYSWKKGLRLDSGVNASESTRIKTENYQLTMKPLQPEHQKTKSQFKIKFSEIQSRLTDFGRRLLVLTYFKHRNFLMKKHPEKYPSIEELEKTHSLDKLTRWHPEFDLSKEVGSLVELEKDLPKKPGCSSTDGPGTPSGRQFLEHFTKTPTTSFGLTPPGTPKKSGSKSPEPEWKSSPEYRRLPATLKKKYEERMIRDQQKAMIAIQRRAAGKVADLSTLKDVATGLKSIFNLEKKSSASLTELVKKLNRSGKLTTEQDTLSKIRALCNLEGVKDGKILEILSEYGEEYLVIKPGATVGELHACVDLKIQREQTK